MRFLNWIIKKLGGYTKEEYRSLETRNSSLSDGLDLLKEDYDFALQEYESTLHEKTSLEEQNIQLKIEYESILLEKTSLKKQISQLKTECEEANLTKTIRYETYPAPVEILMNSTIVPYEMVDRFSDNRLIELVFDEFISQQKDNLIHNFVETSIQDDIINRGKRVNCRMKMVKN